MIHDHRDRRRPAGKLIDPIAHRAEGAEDQKRPVGALLAQKGQKTDELHRLAQAHLIRENAVETDLVQARKPGEPFELIISHCAPGDELGLVRSLRLASLKRLLQLVHHGRGEALLSID